MSFNIVSFMDTTKFITKIQILARSSFRAPIPTSTTKQPCSPGHHAFRSGAANWRPPNRSPHQIPNCRSSVPIRLPRRIMQWPISRSIASIRRTFGARRRPTTLTCTPHRFPRSTLIDTHRSRFLRLNKRRAECPAWVVKQEVLDHRLCPITTRIIIRSLGRWAKIVA